MKNATIIPCPNCDFVVKGGVAYWRCEGYHPECLRWPDLVLVCALLALPVLVLIMDKKRVLSR